MFAGEITFFRSNCPPVHGFVHPPSFQRLGGKTSAGTESICATSRRGNAMYISWWLGLSSLLRADVSALLLDVGAPRTGTQSIHDALEIMGLKALHSGYTQSARDPVCAYLFAQQPLDNALAVLNGYDAAMDEPFMLIYEEVMAAMPDSKFLLTISDAESWYQNYVDLLAMTVTLNVSLTDGRPWYWEPCSAVRFWGCNFVNGTEKEKKTCLENYERHVARVQEVIPAERLLIYNWSDGWTPLAHFVGLPVPDAEFPHKDELKEQLTFANQVVHMITGFVNANEKSVAH
ncbi:unnamed protein product [Durusdinium trenchii]|uniref:Uncharacterized protein n=2 Tax=Durusdinium trenchii TaxID=1381693 RepID=A0ABP0PI70_9DINO